MEEACGLPTCSADTPAGSPCVELFHPKGAVVHNEYQACSSSNILLPGFNLLPTWLLAAVYGITLVWAFFGVALISDIFMASIEVITSAERTIHKRSARNGRYISVSVKVWNATVANLTLMALGSSAPEILLAVIETVMTLGEEPGELGPSTIVGSAAFNLLVIVSVCILAVPEGEVKRIDEFAVFLWTALISLWAYVWMLIVYRFWTPDEVTTLEAWATLLHMPIFVWAAYILDLKPWTRQRQRQQQQQQQQQHHQDYKLLVGAHAHVEQGPPTAPGTKPAADTVASGYSQRHRSEASGALSSDSRSQVLTWLQDQDTDRDTVASSMRGPFRAASLASPGADSSPHAPRSPSGGPNSDARRPTPVARRGGEVSTAGGPPQAASDRRSKAELTQSRVIAHVRQLQEVKRRAGEDVWMSAGDVDNIARKVVNEQGRQLTALQYKINARNALTGRTHLTMEARSRSKRGPEVERSRSAPGQVQRVQCSYIMLASEHFRVMELQKVVRVMVRCIRTEFGPHGTMHVKYRSRDGSALAGSDYEHTHGTLIFEPDVTEQVIEVRVFEDNELEDDEDFFIELYDPTPSCVQLLKRRARIVIVDTTDAGCLEFRHTSLFVEQHEATVTMTIVRKNGSAGSVRAAVCTQSGTASAGVDFRHMEDIVTFEAGEMSKTVQVKLLPKRALERAFMVTLNARPTPEQTRSGRPLVNKRRCICTVRTVEDENISRLQKILEAMLRDKPSAQLMQSSWAQQFREAILPGRVISGGLSSAGDDNDATGSDGAGAGGAGSSLGRSDAADDSNTPLFHVLHYISITWKLLFALVPPPNLWGGLPCFVLSLAAVGGLTYLIAPVASMFGCAVGLSDQMTAIVFVALGTSLPDTFASYQAAVQADSADAAIGNVTGSNAVNVFLGLGLPWVIASTYYSLRGESYMTPAGPLSFSVLVFMVCAVACLCLLLWKRACGGELGGAGLGRTGAAAFTFCLWLLYLVLSGLQSEDHLSWS